MRSLIASGFGTERPSRARGIAPLLAAAIPGIISGIGGMLGGMGAGKEKKKARQEDARQFNLEHQLRERQVGLDEQQQRAKLGAQQNISPARQAIAQALFQKFGLGQMPGGMGAPQGAPPMAPPAGGMPPMGGGGIAGMGGGSFQDLMKHLLASRGM